MRPKQEQQGSTSTRATFRRAGTRATIAALSLVAGACDAPALPPEPEPCPAGQVALPAEGCLTAGLQGCPARFAGEDGLCHPRMAACEGALGSMSIPRFDDPAAGGEGCEPVGIVPCADVFVGADGLCRPAMAACPEGTFPVPQTGCIPIDGDGCGDGTWGNIEPGPDTVYVLAGAAGPGDGSEAAPFPLLGDALEAVPAGGRIVIGAGTYGQPLHILKPVTIEGRCPSLVRLQGVQSLDGVQSALYVDLAEGVTLRSFQLGGAGVGVLAYDAPGLRIERVRVEKATGAGFLLFGGKTDAVLERVSVVGTKPAASGQYGFGLEVGLSARATVAECAFLDNTGAGLLADGALAELVLANSLVESTLPGADGAGGFGVIVKDGATATIEHTAVAGNRVAGIQVAEGATLTARNDLVAGTLPRESDGAFGLGVEVRSATAELIGDAIVDNRTAGVVAADPVTRLTMTASLVAGTLPQSSDGALGIGLGAGGGAEVTVVASTFLRNHASGILIDGAELPVTLTGNLVEDTLPQPDGGLARGVSLQASGDATMKRNVIAGGADAGLFLFGPSGAVTASELLVEGVAGAGIATFPGVDLTLETAAVLDCQVAGVALLGTKAAVRDTLIARIQGGLAFIGGVQGSHPDIGDGLFASTGSTVDVERAFVHGCVRAGMLFSDSDGTIASSVVTENRFGLALQGAKRPAVEEGDNTIEGNSEEDFLEVPLLEIELSGPIGAPVP